jgi:hypothetical protein
VRELSVRSAMIIAIAITTASFANSAGWIDRPPIISQEREPLIVVPITSTRTSPITDPTYTSGVTMRTHRWSVAITAAASTRPIMMLTRCLCR